MPDIHGMGIRIGHTFSSMAVCSAMPPNMLFSRRCAWPSIAADIVVTISGSSVAAASKHQSHDGFAKLMTIANLVGCDRQLSACDPNSIGCDQEQNDIRAKWKLPDQSIVLQQPGFMMQPLRTFLFVRL